MLARMSQRNQSTISTNRCIDAQLRKLFLFIRCSLHFRPSKQYAFKNTAKTHSFIDRSYISLLPMNQCTVLCIRRPKFHLFIYQVVNYLNPPNRSWLVL